MAVVRGHSISSFGQMFPSISGAGEAVVSAGKVWLELSQDAKMEYSILKRGFPYVFPFSLTELPVWLRSREDEKLEVRE